MRTIDDLQLILDRLDVEARQAGMTVVPAVLNGRGFEVEWPDPQDVTGFLAAAHACGAAVLYLAASRADELDGFDADVSERPSGDIALVQAAWVASGVVHRIDALANWCEHALAAAQLSDDLAFHNLRADVEQMARTIVDDDAFSVHAGPRDDAKYAIIDARFPDLDPRTRMEVLRAANRIDTVERKPVREATWAAEGHKLRAAGATKVAAAEKLGISVNVLNRVLQQHPPHAT